MVLAACTLRAAFSTQPHSRSRGGGVFAIQKPSQMTGWI